MKVNIKKFHSELNDILRNLASKHGVEFVPSRLTYSSVDMSCRVQFVQMLTETNADATSLAMGFADPGTRVVVPGHPEFGEGRIVLSKRVKYVVEFPNHKTKPGRWNVRFHQIALAGGK